jgi:hypothetical protein
VRKHAGFFSRKRKGHLGNEWGGGDLKVCGIKKKQKKQTNNHAPHVLNYLQDKYMKIFYSAVQSNLYHVFFL